MGRDNRDRYGYRHRQDSAYDVGDTKPGDVGDSQGTFYDRATSDNNVIVDGRVQSYESHQRNQSKGSETNRSKSKPTKNKKQKSKPRQSQKGQFAELNGEVVEVEVERISGSGNPIATYRGIHVHVPQGTPGDTYEVKLNAKSGYFVGKINLKE